MCTRPRSCPIGPVRPENLALRPVLSMHVSVRPVRLENLAVRPWASVYVPFVVHLGLYARETWLYAPGRVYTSPFVPLWACTPLKPGFTPRFAYTRARSSPCWPVRLENLPMGECVCSF